MIERAVVLAEGDSIGLADLPSEIVSRAAVQAHPGRRPPATVAFDGPTAANPSHALTLELADLERERLIDALAQCSGNKTQAARLLGIPRSTLFSKLRKLGLT